ncbi:MAG: two-component system sensor kinase [Bryobacterales bacterium]|nr:two-component system sensor kinase [Bryobacterales bacterium]
MAYPLLKRGVRRRFITTCISTFVVVIILIGAWRLRITRPGYGLPFTPHFGPGEKAQWTALGGVWEVLGNSIRNDANDRGAKIITGSPHWKDYRVESDVQLLGSGSVGLLARVSEAEVGENSYKGYWAGVRTGDNSLVLGVFDFAYHEAAKVVLPERVRPFRWYHVRMQVAGCRITAWATAPGMDAMKVGPVTDPDCFPAGSIGLRSNGTGGVWRNISVLPVNGAEPPPSEGSKSPGAASLVALPRRAEAAPSQPASVRQPLTATEGAPTVPSHTVNSLQYLAPFGHTIASIRGAVVLTRPAVYVQDQTGGIEIEGDSATPLKIGDEIEATGLADLEGFSPRLQHAQIRVLREAVPLSPLSLTANQIATGTYDGRFVQVEGFLRKVGARDDGSVEFELENGTQAFRSVFPPGRSRSHLRDIVLGSRLRLRGVSVVARRFNKESDPFVVLARSAEDADVVLGPPWWRPSNLILAALVTFAVGFTINHLFLIAKHWRLRAVADERERLAHEIHDTLAQSFAGIGFQLQAIRNSVPSGAVALEGQIDLAMSMARTSHEEARRSIASLRPESLGQVGLLPALRDCAERMVKHGQLKVETAGDEESRSVPPRIEDALYRIGQEAIANAIRHANPNTLRIRLLRIRRSICLSVEDDGDGFAADSDRAGFGLLGMRKRAESISATLSVISTPGSGTRVEVKATIRPRFLPWPWHGLEAEVRDL